MDVVTTTEQLFFTTTRIDTVDLAGNHGSGTGFFFNYELDGLHYHFLITNKHVVRDKAQGWINLIRGADDKPILGEPFRLEIDRWDTHWTDHPDPMIDLCATPATPLVEFIKANHGTNIYWRTIPQSMAITREIESELDAIEPVTFVGYPNAIWDSVNYLPIARRGATASPLSIDWEAMPKFIIDASVFGGSSGSPVFIANQGSYHKKGEGLMLGDRTLFAGVISSVFYRTQLNQIVSRPVPVNTAAFAEGQEMLDLGIVIKARVVIELVELILRRAHILPDSALVIE